MRYLKEIAVLLFCLALPMTAFANAETAPTKSKEEITIGLVDTFSPDFYIHTYSPTLDHLLETLPSRRFKFVELDYRHVEEDIRRLRPDFLVTSGSLYAALMGSVGSHQIATRQPKTSPKPSETVSSAFVVRASSRYRTLADLQGARAAISDRRSFDGWLIAQGELAKEGLDPEHHFGELIETSYGVPDVGTLVKIGAADVGVLSTCEYEQLLANGVIRDGDFRILAEKPAHGGCIRSTDRYPDVVFSSLPWVDAETVREATVSILSMPSENLDFQWTVCNDFVPTFELLRVLSIGPFEGQTVKAVVFSGFKATRKVIDKICADVEVQTGSKAYWFRLDENGELVGGISKFLADRKDAVIEALSLKPGDFVGLAAGKKLAAQKTAGVLRKVLGNTVEGHMKKECYEFCWIVDFPMYEIGEESGKLEFCHNPFSMPQGGLKDLEEKDPLEIYAYQYDLVCNGVELSSGAVRNHDPEIMVKAFELVGLGEDDVKAKFPAMYNAFCYGAPPHAGIAPGVDRMVMLIAGEESIREIIPFPMNKTAQDVMMGAPAEVDPKQLEDVHIRVVMPEKE